MTRTQVNLKPIVSLRLQWCVFRFWALWQRIAAVSVRRPTRPARYDSGLGHPGRNAGDWTKRFVLTSTLTLAGRPGHGGRGVSCVL